MVDDQCAEASGPRTVKGRAADLRPARNEEVPVAAGPCADQEFRRESKLQPQRHHDRRRYCRRKDHAGSEECSNAENERRALSNAREDISEQLRVQVKERPRTPGNTEDADNADQTGAEDRTGSKLFRRHAAKHDDEESRSQHHHLNERRDRKL